MTLGSVTVMWMNSGCAQTQRRAVSGAVCAAEQQAAAAFATKESANAPTNLVILITLSRVFKALLHTFCLHTEYAKKKNENPGVRSAAHERERWIELVENLKEKEKNIYQNQTKKEIGN